ncbi:hypothetical protein HaLaN_27324 [Haematococcus lacustris]|uniref:Uncharacterized protein n=1 Tax=Haematococcus lacustris TaxID=44745 RepID=A0A6A0A9P0_HAELA|nr:hypothetical protein HaLaN_27324 [Haematococcus lacustris]
MKGIDDRMSCLFSNAIEATAAVTAKPRRSRVNQHHGQLPFKLSRQVQPRERLYQVSHPAAVPPIETLPKLDKGGDRCRPTLRPLHQPRPPPPAQAPPAQPPPAQAPPLPAAPGPAPRPQAPQGAGGWTGTPTGASTSNALGRACSAPWSCVAMRAWRLCPPLARSTSRATSASMTGCPRAGRGCTGLQSTGGALMAGPATMHRPYGQGELAPGKSAIGVGFVVIKGATEVLFGCSRGTVTALTMLDSVLDMTNMHQVHSDHDVRQTRYAELLIMGHWHGHGMGHWVMGPWHGPCTCKNVDVYL